MTAVAVVADVGIGGDVYRVLELGEAHRTGGGIDHYSHVEMVDGANVDDAVKRIEERYGTRLTETDTRDRP